MNAHERRSLIASLVLCDVVMSVAALAVAAVLRCGMPGWPGGMGTTRGLEVLIFSPLLSLVLMANAGLYEPDGLFSGHREYAGVVRASTYTAFALLLLAFLFDISLARGALILTWGLSCLLVGGGRFLFRRGVFRARRSGGLLRRALIAGTDAHAIAITGRLADPATGWRIIGFLDDYLPLGAHVVDGLCVVGDPSAAAEIAAAMGASDVILVPHAVSWEAQRDLIELAATCDRPALRLAPGLYHLLATGARPLDANSVPLLSLERLRVTGLDATMKALLDAGLSLAALPGLAALLGLLWGATRLSGGGPVLERRPALGLRGARFDLLLLAQPEGQPPVRDAGRWAWRLRSWAAHGRLGKLPNLLNVLRRRMSLIGPRALDATTNLSDHDWARTLLLVRPGMTGPHSANGHQWSSEEQAILDVAYVREYSLWVDLRLLFASARGMLRGRRSLPASYAARSELLLEAERAAR
jgi:lipopolysaccharide/colanic/teichoic acid biosynthesis glycosyltransferase